MLYSTMRARLEVLGGNQVGRIKKQKYKSFKSALKSDYNSRIVIDTSTKRAWKSLINDNLLKPDYDRKIISIDYKSCFTSGTTFETIDDHTYWMVYLPDLAEIAYLKAEIIRCRYSLDINGENYKIYFQGPTETTIQWFSKSKTEFNEPNWSGTVFIKRDKNTENYFHRFSKIKIDGHIWEVQVVDKITVPGIIELEVQEYYDNEYAELPEIIMINNENSIIGLIDGKPGDVINYKIKPEYFNEESEWSLSNDCAEILELIDEGRACKIKINNNNSDSIVLSYGDYCSIEIKIDENKTDEFPIVGPEEIYPYDTVVYSSNKDGKFRIDTSLVKIVENKENVCVIDVLTVKKGNFILYFDASDGEVYELPISIKSM